MRLKLFIACARGPSPASACTGAPVARAQLYMMPDKSGIIQG